MRVATWYQPAYLYDSCPVQVRITMSNAAIKDYRSRLTGMQDELSGISRKYGAHYVSVVSDEDLVSVLLSGFSGILAGVS